MTLYALKPAFLVILRPLAAHLVARGLTANQVTVATTLLSIVAGAVVALNAAASPAFFLLIPLALALRIPLNAVDGLMARDFRQKTPLGTYLNELGDVLSDAALMLPFALVPPLSTASVGSLVFLALLTEFAGVLAPSVGGTREFTGPLGKSDRALLLGALGLWVGMGGALPEEGARIGVLVVAALLVVTVVRRVQAGLRAAARPS